jgi:hypothetical protein
MPKKKVKKKSPKKRIPKKGDRVAALGHHGTFVVSDVGRTIEAVELRMIGRSFALSTIPWGTLTYLDELDASRLLKVRYRPSRLSST